MWIAKNSLTGYEYPVKFSSIYDCSDYIAKELFIIEYLSQRIFVLEKSITDEDAYNTWFKEKYGDDFNFALHIYARIEYALKDFMKDLSIDEKPSVISDTYTKNHIIRCYNVEQKRFANGFDF